MRIFVITTLALIVGFVIGVKLSEVIGIVGVLGFGRAVGIRYLPFYTGIALAVFANLADVFARRKSKKANE